MVISPMGLSDIFFLLAGASASSIFDPWVPPTFDPQSIVFGHEFHFALVCVRRALKNYVSHEYINFILNLCLNI
jgi:hypothetical protein